MDVLSSSGVAGRFGFPGRVITMPTLTAIMHCKKIAKIYCMFCYFAPTSNLLNPKIASTIQNNNFSAPWTLPAELAATCCTLREAKLQSNTHATIHKWQPLTTLWELSKLRIIMVVVGEQKSTVGGTSYRERESFGIGTYAASRDLAKYPSNISKRLVNDLV
jgi:hypothetical protein